MYKDRISAWGIDKKTKDHEARAILRLHAQRIGKPTQMRLRGRPVNINKIESYFKRKGILVEDVLSADSVPSLDIDLVCRRPSPITSPVACRAIISTRLNFPRTSPENFASHGSQVVAAGTLRRRIEAPDGLKIVELIFADMREIVTEARFQAHASLRSRLIRFQRGYVIPRSGIVFCCHGILCRCKMSVRSIDRALLRPTSGCKGSGVGGHPRLIELSFFWVVEQMFGFDGSPMNQGSCERCSRVASMMVRPRIDQQSPNVRQLAARFTQLKQMDEPLNLISKATKRVVVDTLKVVCVRMCQHLV